MGGVLTIAKAILGALAGVFALLPAIGAAQEAPPNIVVIFVDDMGYADLGAFGNPSIETPNLDRLAADGQKWTNFYVAASVCTPSRAGLLTGRLPVRSGTLASGGGMRVFFPFSDGGLPGSEVTIAELVKQRGYRTAAIGKWHLGHKPEFLPTRQGFDSYYGIPYSNDMDATELFDGWDAEIAGARPDIHKWNVPLLRDEEEIERPADQNTITRRYTQEAVEFIRQNSEAPFFLYLAHNLPHVPLFASEEFRQTSRRGIYGDVVEELDWSVGRVVAALEEQGIADNTLVVFTSDNGPWLVMRQHSGTAGMLRDGKGTTWDGGMRVPAIFYWPGTVKPEVIQTPASTLDLMPTVAALTGAQLPRDRLFDGTDLTGLLTQGEADTEIDRPIYFMRNGEVYAIRLGDYKAHFITQSSGYGEGPGREAHETPLLYDLADDPAENFDVAGEHADIIEAMIRARDDLMASVEPVENQLDKYRQEERDAYFSR